MNAPWQWLLVLCTIAAVYLALLHPILVRRAIKRWEAMRAGMLPSAKILPFRRRRPGPHGG